MRDNGDTARRGRTAGPSVEAEPGQPSEIVNGVLEVQMVHLLHERHQVPVGVVGKAMVETFGDVQDERRGLAGAERADADDPIADSLQRHRLTDTCDGIRRPHGPS